MRLEDVCTVFTDGDWIESKDQRVYHKEMEAPIEDMKRFLDGILHIYDEGRTAVKMGDLFGIVGGVPICGIPEEADFL